MRNRVWSKQVAIALGVMPASMLFAAWVQSAVAQAPAVKPDVRVSPVILAEPDVETSLSVQVGPDAAIPRQTFLRIRGLPLSVKLSDGHVVSPGVWAVPITALNSLRLVAPVAGSGRTELHFALVSVDGGVLAEARSSLVVAPAWLLGSSNPKESQRAGVAAGDPTQVASLLGGAPPEQPKTQTAPSVFARATSTPAAPAVQPPPPATSPVAPRAEPPAGTVRSAPSGATTPRQPQGPAVIAALPPPPAASAPAIGRTVPPAQVTIPSATTPPITPATPAEKLPALSPADRARAEAMVQRAETLLTQGNMAAARQFFRRAADLGLAQGALRMGATYDPLELPSMPVVGMQPDPKEAQSWYERAHQLGATEAGPRISRLQGR